MENQNLSSLDGLTEIGFRGGVDMRPTLLRVLTDLYVQKLSHTPDEQRHYTELAIRLLEAVDVATRVAVASRLSRHLSPPLRVLQMLVGDLPDVAIIVRAHPLLQAPARIETPPPVEVPPAAEQSDADDGDLFADAPYVVDADTAEKLNALFFAAKADERRLILLNLDIVAPLPRGRVGALRDPSVALRLEAAALARKREDFAHHLARSLQIPHAQARRVVGDNLGEPLVVAGKALGIRRDMLYRILLFANASVGHSVERVHALAKLHDEMTSEAAEGLVAIWQALRANEGKASGYRPLPESEERRQRARVGATAQRFAPASPAGERRTGS